MTTEEQHASIRVFPRQARGTATCPSLGERHALPASESSRAKACPEQGWPVSFLSRLEGLIPHFVA